MNEEFFKYNLGREVQGSNPATAYYFLLKPAINIRSYFSRLEKVINN